MSDERHMVVAQLGARRHYAVPLAFSKHGRLLRFFTDFYLHSGIASSAVGLAAKISQARALRRMEGRKGAQLPPECVHSFPVFGLHYKLRLQRARKESERTAAWMWAGRRFCELTARRIGDRCSSVYAFSSAAKELFEHAHEIGARTCLDHATAPFAYERALVQEEYQRFSGWALDEEPDSLIARYDQRQREELFLADTVVCGSSFIREAIVAQGVDSGKMRVVPLGISERFFRLRRHPKTGDRALRVLFIGDDGLRKGIGYLARAAARLRPLKVNVRVVGDLKISEKGLGELRESVELMGPVPRKDIDALLSWADVLALPSVSDTFGLVVLEAMAAGVPVIATPHTCAPDVIRDGVDGFIVPIRDEEAIAIKLDRIAGDADLLHEMSVNARARALDFTLDHYADRLVHATSN